MKAKAKACRAKRMGVHAFRVAAPVAPPRPPRTRRPRGARSARPSPAPGRMSAPRTTAEGRPGVGQMSGSGGPIRGLRAPVRVDGPRSGVKGGARRGRRKIAPAPCFWTVPAPCRRPPRPCRSPGRRPASPGRRYPASGRDLRRRRRARLFYLTHAPTETVDRISPGVGRRTPGSRRIALVARSHLRAGSAAPSAGRPAPAGLAMPGRDTAATGSPRKGARR